MSDGDDARLVILWRAESVSSVDERELWDAVVASNRAWLQGRVSEVAGLFHADAVAVAGAGRRVEGRDAIVRSYADYCAAAKTHAFEELEHTVDVLGDVAVVTYRFSVRYEMNGVTYDELGREVLVFTRQDGRWGVAWRTQIPSGG